MSNATTAIVAVGRDPTPQRSTESDQRWIVDHDLGLFVIADAIGPSYGGYHAPYGIDEGLSALLRSYRAERGPEGLRRAIEAADQAMRGVDRHLTAAQQARMADAGGDALTAARLAADDLRPARFASLAGRSLAHAAGSMAALAIGPHGTAATTAVGDCRIYCRRAGILEVVAWDDTLTTVRAREGSPPPPPFHADICIRLLGMGEQPVKVDLHVQSHEPGDEYLLCSFAVWYCAGPDVLEIVPFVASPLQSIAATCTTSRGVDSLLVAVGTTDERS